MAQDIESSAGTGRTIGAQRRSPVDPLQQHRELRRAQRHRPLARLRPDEPAPLQPLGEQAETLAVPIQHLDQVSASATKDEQMPGERIVPQHLLRPQRKPVEPFAHIRRAQRQVHPHARRNRDHRRSGAAASRASTAGSIRSATRSTRPLPSTISTSPIEAALPSVLSGTAGAAGGSSFISRTARTSGATRTGTNPAAAVTAASSPPRICRRQRYSRLRQTSCRRATSATPRSAASPTSRTFSSLDQDRRRPTPVMISIRGEATVQTPLFATMPAPSAPTLVTRDDHHLRGKPDKAAIGRRLRPGAVSCRAPRRTRYPSLPPGRLLLHECADQLREIAGRQLIDRGADGEFGQLTELEIPPAGQ